MNVNQTPGMPQLSASKLQRLNTAELAKLQHAKQADAKAKAHASLDLKPLSATAVPARPALAASADALTEADLDSIVSETQNDLALQQGGGSAYDDPVQSLMDAWGSDSAEHDLNNDGTVNLLDLLDLLSRSPDELPQTEQPGAAPPNQVDATPEAPAKPDGEIDYQRRLDALYDAWGTDDAQSDLNGDGTVNLFDLLALLDEQPTQTPIGTATAPAGDNTPADSVTSSDHHVASANNDTPAVDTPSDETELSVENLTNAWGETDSKFDLNQDGTVNLFDLLELLDRLGQESSNDTALTAGPDNQPAQAADEPSRDQLRQRAIDHIAESIVSKLHDRGFESQPPSNLDSVLQRLNLFGDQQQSVRQRVLAGYPVGGAVNTRV